MKKFVINEVSVGQMVKRGKGMPLNEDMVFFDDVKDLPLPNEPRRLDCHILALCLKGKVQYSVDTVPYIVRGGELIIISKGQVADDYLISRDFEGIGIMLSEDFFNEIIRSIPNMASIFLFAKNNPVCHLMPNEVKTIVKYTDLIREKLEDRTHHFQYEATRALITTMIIDLSNLIFRVQKNSTKRQTRYESVFFEFIETIEKNFRTERRVGWYADQLCVTNKYLTEAVKSVSNRTPNEWINSYTTLEIKVLLKNSAMSVKEIADLLNFPNQSFLGKYFKEKTGISPTTYRNG